MNTKLIPNRALCVLVTGFGPFPGAPSNPTQQLVARLARLRRPATAALRLVTHVFPTSYAAVDQQLAGLIDKHQPDAIVMFGLAGRSKAIRIETLARNRTTRVYPDIDRKIPQRASIMPGARQPARAGAFCAARGRGAHERFAGALVAGCRYLPMQLRLLARVGTTITGGRPSRGGVCSRPQHAPSPENKRSLEVPDLDQLLRAAQNVVIAAAAAVRRQD